ncbi:MAG: hypothetical protein ACYS7M_06865 [Planctomycetota bacterium]|jgi:hypothetical protein
MDEVFEAAKAADPPAEAMRYEQSAFRLLVTLCRELQRRAGDGPFYLGCRTAGRLLGVEHTTAWRWLYLMVSDGLLVVAERGAQAGGQNRATRYFYVGGDGV